MKQDVGPKIARSQLRNKKRKTNKHTKKRMRKKHKQESTTGIDCQSRQHVTRHWAMKCAKTKAVCIWTVKADNM